MAPDLLVNIDHVATLRNARKETFPDPIEAAKLCLQHGASGIVFHLREDRRHINDDDVKRLASELECKLDFELSSAPEIVAICCEIKPAMATLVPEKREEITTEGGLDLRKPEPNLIEAVRKLKSAEIPVSFFMDPDLDQIRKASELGADCIELHTGNYANASSKENIEKELARMTQAGQLCDELNLRVHAGHGLDRHNYKAFGEAVPQLKEVSIGFYLVARAISLGIGPAVAEMNELIQNTHK